MADVQLEHGHTRIADTLFEALIRAAMPGRHKDVVWAILRLTYGYQRTERKMGAALIHTLVPIDKRRIRGILTDLQKWGLIERSKVVNGATATIRLVKDFEQWRLPCGEKDPEKKTPGYTGTRVDGDPGGPIPDHPGIRGPGDPGIRGPATRDNLETTLETESAPRVPRGPPRGPTDPPEALSPEDRAKLREWRTTRKPDDPVHGLSDRDLERAEDACLDWYRAKGRRQKDWLATVRTWIRRDLDPGKANAARASPPSPPKYPSLVGYDPTV